MPEQAVPNPEVLVETEWLAEHLDDPDIRIVEVDEDVLLYDVGHIPGAVKIDWVADLNDPVRRDYLDREAFSRLASSRGISNDTTVIFYGDKDNWWATYAFWVFKLFRHQRAKILNGGRKKWIKEGRPLSRETPQVPPGRYEAPERDDLPIRAFRDQVLEHVRAGRNLSDGVSANAAEVAGLHLGGQLLAAGWVNPLADDDKRPAWADHNGFGRG